MPKNRFRTAAPMEPEKPFKLADLAVHTVRKLRDEHGLWATIVQRNRQEHAVWLHVPISADATPKEKKQAMELIRSACGGAIQYTRRQIDRMERKGKFIALNYFEYPDTRFSNLIDPEEENSLGIHFEFVNSPHAKPKAPFCALSRLNPDDRRKTP